MKHNPEEPPPGSVWWFVLGFISSQLEEMKFCHQNHKEPQICTTTATGALGS